MKAILINLNIIYLSFFISAFLTYICILIARRIKFVDIPDKVLKVHKEPVAYLGGSAVFLTIIIFAFLYQSLFDNKEIELLKILLGSSFVLHILGLIDDKKRLGPVIKLCIQIIVALITAKFLYLKIRYFPFIVNYILACIWLVLVMNSINLIDILDGLASMIVIIASFIFLIIDFSCKDALTFFLPCILIGSLSGFLVFNFKKAKIYLGDSGSVVIGYLIGSIAIIESYTKQNVIGFLSPILILCIPLYDTIFVSIIRILKGESPLKGSKDHIALKIKQITNSDTETVIFLSLIALFFGLLAYVITSVSIEIALILYLIAFLNFVVGGRILSKIEVK